MRSTSYKDWGTKIYSTVMNWLSNQAREAQEREFGQNSGNCSNVLDSAGAFLALQSSRDLSANNSRVF